MTYNYSNNCSFETKSDRNSWGGFDIHKPRSIEHKDEEGRFHNFDGPAIYNASNFSEYKVYYIHGEFIEKKIAEKILKAAYKEDLIEFLLDNNKNIRDWAEYKLNKIQSLPSI